jgi:hypothetical protein
MIAHLRDRCDRGDRFIAHAGHPVTRAGAPDGVVPASSTALASRVPVATGGRPRGGPSSALGDPGRHARDGEAQRPTDRDQGALLEEAIADVGELLGRCPERRRDLAPGGLVAAAVEHGNILFV